MPLTIKYLLLPALLFYGSHMQLKAQALRLPEPGFMYNDSSVLRIDISIHPDSLAALMLPANWYSDHEYPVNVVFTRGTEIHSLQQVGLRLRGNTSRNAAKKSFRISINSFQAGRRFDGYKNLNLIASHNDPGIIRAKMYFDLSRGLEAVGSRSAHAALYINGQYYGLYTNVEHINDDFVQHRYGNKNGNLYKCLFPADLAYISNHPNDYKFMAQGRRVYDLKTNEQADDYTGLANLIRTIHHTPAAQIYCHLDTLLNIEDFLLMQAIDVATGHWDGYYNKNNFYLYQNSRTGKFEFIPYDVDNTFGIDWFNINWMTINPYQFKPSNQARPLYEKLMDNAQTRDIYSFYLRKVSQYLQSGQFQNWVDSLHNRITPYALSDSFRTLDYGYNAQSFLQSTQHTQAIGHVKQGVKPFINGRNTSTQSLIPANFNIAPIVHHPLVSGLRSNVPTHILVKVEDENTAQLQVVALINYNGTNFTVPLFDDGLHNDNLAGDGIFGGFCPSFSQPGNLQVRIRAIDQQQQVSIRPCAPLRFEVRAGGPIYINEFLASNSTGIRDEANQASDWIELYNSSTEPYALQGHSLSDNFNNPGKWLFPNDTIAPGAFYLVWASNAIQRGPRHAAFALSANGEEIGFYKVENGLFNLLDSISFGPQQTDHSMGRLPDGGNDWVYFTTPTPLASNGNASSLVEKHTNLAKVYPNPFQTHIQVQHQLSGTAKYELYDVHGKLLLEGALTEKTQSIQVHQLPTGIYLLRIRSKTAVQDFRLLRE
ncbi:MAG: CotH kinase family protein [Bacteroidia bacterium]